MNGLKVLHQNLISSSVLWSFEPVKLNYLIKTVILINFVLSIFCCCCGFQDAHFTSLLHFWLRSSILERNWQKCWSRHDNLIAFVILNLFVLPAKSHHIPQYNCNCIIDIFLPVFCAHASYLIPSHSSHTAHRRVSAWMISLRIHITHLLEVKQQKLSWFGSDEDDFIAIVIGCAPHIPHEYKK